MNVHFTQTAQADLASILDYISRENRRAARQVVAEIERATERLSQFPLSGRLGAIPTTRELIIPRLPFIAVYRIIDDTVEIIAVFHTAQDRPRG